MKKLHLALLSCLLFGYAQLSAAQPFYAGAGLSLNLPKQSADYEFAMGYQIYGGYDLGIKIADIAYLSIEAGLYDTGSYKGKAIIDVANNTIKQAKTYNSSGLWVSAVFDYTISNKIGAHAITGIDLGDDSGLILGGGLSYILGNMIKFNADYIIKGESSSAQINAAYHF